MSKKWRGNQQVPDLHGISPGLIDLNHLI